MSRLLLLRPPSIFSKFAYSAAVTMPLGLAYLAASLLEAGHEVEVIDALGEAVNHIGISYSPTVQYRGLSTPSIIARVTALAAMRKIDAIGITTMFSQDWPHIEDLINALHSHLPNLPILLGGEHATAAADYILENCTAVSCIALGEGEQTIVEYAEYLAGHKSISEVSGIVCRHNAEILRMPPRQRMRNPDDIPWPAWHLFNLEPYFSTGEGMGVERGRSMPLLATRGCPYQCTFCSSPTMWTTRYVMRSVVNVVDEIAYYMQTYDVSNIDFFDLTAIIKREWTINFAQELKRRGIKVTWQLPSGTRSEAMDNEVLREMASAGCTNVTYSPESGSTRTLSVIKKKVKLLRLYDSIRHAKKNGIFVKCNLIIGFPKENRWDMLQSVWAAIYFAFLGVDDTGIYPYSPYPGSELYDYLRRTGAIAKMDRAYFQRLMTFMDLTQIANYCEDVGAKEIGFYRLFGMCMFYGLSYLFHPSRILRSIRNYKQHKSDTIFEERLFGVLRRYMLTKASP